MSIIGSIHDTNKGKNEDFFVSISLKFVDFKFKSVGGRSRA